MNDLRVDRGRKNTSRRGTFYAKTGFIFLSGFDNHDKFSNELPSFNEMCWVITCTMKHKEPVDIVKKEKR